MKKLFNKMKIQLKLILYKHIVRWELNDMMTICNVIKITSWII